MLMAHILVRTGRSAAQWLLGLSCSHRTCLAMQKVIKFRWNQLVAKKILAEPEKKMWQPMVSVLK